MTLTKRCFFGIAPQLRRHFASRFAEQPPVYMFVEKWVLTSTTFQRVNNCVIREHYPTQRRYFAASAGGQYDEWQALP